MLAASPYYHDGELFHVPVEFVDVNLLNGENTTPEYLKKNPMHTVPVLEDGDFILTDSQTIILYLADQFGKQDSFYPKDVNRRALVNQKLFFNSAVLVPKISNIATAIFHEGLKTVPEKQLDEIEIEEAYGYLEEFLTQTKYVAGNDITVADIAAFSTITSQNVLKKLDPKKYPKLQAWIEDIGQQPFAKKNTGVEILKKIFDSMLT